MSAACPLHLDAGLLQGILGYANFSTGKPDPRFQLQVNEAFASLVGQGSACPWQELGVVLRDGLQALEQGGSAAFREVEQARAVLDIAFSHMLKAYRAHHAVLLAHQGDAELFQPFFLARVVEAVLAQRGPWSEANRIVAGALKMLNDFVGYRPIATLETRQTGEPYEHERVRPIPVYLRGAGVAHGPFEPLLVKTMEILRATEPALLADACFDPDSLDELALDPRGYDFDHPADKRPNYCFGEWDPHHIDNQGNYRRFVIRQIIVDGLWQRVAAPTEAGLPEAARDELLFEAAAVLAGTILMAAGVSGSAPSTYDSTTNLGNLIPRIAKYREAFYAGVVATIQAEHAERLRRETDRTRQPFGGARQHLNRYLAQQRALQMQQRHLALLIAELGYPAASRRQLRGMSATALRLLTEIHVLLATGDAAVDQGNLAEAAANLPRIENLIKIGIACGALVDPWNILGFAGQFPRSPALEDSILDPRIDALVRVIERQFNLYARLLSEGAAHGSFTPGAGLAKDMRDLAEWWDRFATTTVADIAHVHGGEATASAHHVAQALSHWRARGSASADLAFWREHLDDFHSAKAFALVVDALLRKHDYRAAMALLMTWLSHGAEASLEDGDFSFHQLALRWMLGVSTLASAEVVMPAPQSPAALIVKFFDYLEANAEDLAQVPRLDLLGTGEDGSTAAEPGKETDADGVFGAAYEGMTYKDSTDDDVESELLDFMPQRDFDLAQEAERLEQRLKYLATLARLWNVATRAVRAAQGNDRPACQQALDGWLDKARETYDGLLQLLDAIHEHEVPKPSGSYDSLVEFDKRRLTKEHLLSLVIMTCLDQALAIGALRGAGAREPAAHADADPAAAEHGASEDNARFGWEHWVLRLERALLNRDPALARSWLPKFVQQVREEPLLYTPLSHGGHPRQILRANIAQTILRGLVANLPRQGLIRETYQMVLLAHVMEQRQPLTGPRVTEFDRLFQLGVQAVAEAVVDAAQREKIAPEPLCQALEAVIEPFLKTWIDQAKTLRVATLETLASEKEWTRLSEFIKQYGHDLFHARFMTLANLRGILHRGIGPYLDYLSANPDPLHPIGLVEAIDNGLARRDPERWLHIILQTIIENYDHYRDFNTTTTQSDYGENLYQLLDFLRLKASYERNAWQLRPLNLVHEVLAKKDAPAAALWRGQVQEMCRRAADDHLHELARLEQMHGMRLATIADKIEERFVKPMALDGLCALIEPAMSRAPVGAPDQNAEDAIVPLEEALTAQAATPTGVGLDVPHWILRLEGEVHRVRTSQTALANLAETLFQVPTVAVPFAELAAQLHDWKKMAD